jgi:hypothetical protein
MKTWSRRPPQGGSTGSAWLIPTCADNDFWLAGFAAQIRDLDAGPRELLDPRFRNLAEAGLSIGLTAYDAAMKARADLWRRRAPSNAALGSRNLIPS